LGEILAGPNFEGEAILVADLDLGDIVRGKYDFDVVGHYARPDVFSLAVNEKPQPPVSRLISNSNYIAPDPVPASNGKSELE
jgi:hypothetical protein